MGAKSRRPAGGGRPAATTTPPAARTRARDAARERLRAPLAAACALVSLGAAIYANALPAPFVLDDVPSIVENPYIRQLWPPAYVSQAEANAITTARPLVALSLAVNYAIGGLDVRVYRLTNLAIHLLAAVLLFLVVRRTLRMPVLRDRFGPPSTGLAFASALLWMAHPLQTQVVNYISQRTESMMGLFYLLTLYCAIRAAGAGAGAARGWSAAAIAACAAGMASKQVMVTAPVAVAVWDWAFLNVPFREQMARRWPLYAGLASTWLVMGLLMWTFPDTNVGSGVSPWDYALSQSVVIAQYLRRAIWPTGLLFDYGLPGRTPVAAAAPYLVLIAILLAATAFALRRARPIGFLAAWFFLVLAPTSSVVPLATEVGAERRMYLPLAGLVVLAVVGLYLLAGRMGGASGAGRRGAAGGLSGAYRVAALAVILVAALFAWLTVRRNELHTEPVALWQSVVEQRPGNVRALNNLGTALHEAGRRSEAVDYYRRALAVDGHFAPARHNLGKSLFDAGQFDEAAANFRAALEVTPTAALHTDLGAALEAAGRVDEAAVSYRTALGLDPDYADAHLNLGRAHFARHEVETAIEHYEASLRLQPRDPRTLTVMGTALASLGRFEEATAHYRRALEIEPGYEPALQNLGSALQAQGRGDEAVEHYREVAQRSGTVASRALLARSLAAQGRADEAVAEYQAVLAAPGLGAAVFAQAHRDLGDLFLSRQELDRAIDHYRQALAREPGAAEGHFGLGVALGLAGRVDASVPHFEEAVRLAPDWPQALGQLAALLTGEAGAKTRDPARAVRLAERAVELAGGADPALSQVLAGAYAAAGRPADARAAAQAAERAREAPESGGRSSSAAGAPTGR